MATFVFDTHRAVKDLEEAGFPEAQAEALVEIVGLAVGENAATKGDLDAMERRIVARFEAQEKQNELRFAAQEEKFNARIDALESKQDADIRAVRADMRNMEWRITLKFVAILLPSMGLLFAALRFLT